MALVKASSTLRAAIFASLLLLLLRLLLAQELGFGDAEALYVSYALHPQPAYLDHPGLIGSIARLLGGGAAPTPLMTHIFTALLATAIPWLGGLAARILGANWTQAARSVLALALVPEISIGLFGLSPDLPLAAFWLSALCFGLLMFRLPPRGFAALLSGLGLGLCLGLACLSKVSAALLGLSVLFAFGHRAARAHLKTPAPWCALALFGILVAPLVHWEIQHGFPMLEHRLVSTQSEAGFSFRNLAALIGGQMLYVTPPFLIAAFFVLRDLRQRYQNSAADALLWFSFWVPAIPLVLLCLWSKVAEPHWLAPAYLPLAIHASRVELSPRLKTSAVVTGGVAALFAFLWVKTPLFIKVLGRFYEPRYDIANDLHAWGPGRRLLEEAVAGVLRDGAPLPVVVGPHWIVCAQAHAALGRRVPVGCHTPRPTDFSAWYPAERWTRMPVLLFVYDSRFELDPEKLFPNYKLHSMSRTEVRRGDRSVRTLRISRLQRVRDIASTQ